MTLEIITQLWRNLAIRTLQANQERYNLECGQMCVHGEHRLSSMNKESKLENVPLFTRQEMKATVSPSLVARMGET